MDAQVHNIAGKLCEGRKKKKKTKNPIIYTKYSNYI